MKFYFEEAALWEDRKREIFSKINQSRLPLVLFGGSAGVNAAFLQDIQVPVRFICDNSPELWGQKFWGLEVIPPAKLQEWYREYNVLILVPYDHEIVSQLRSLPVPPAEIFRLDFYYVEEDTAEYFRSMQGSIEEVYNLLADQASKDTYEAVLHYRINRDPQILSGVTAPSSQQYYPPSLGGEPFLNSEEVFVDAGAYSGDTVHSFIAAVQGRYQSIYAFEPEPENYQKLLHNTKDIPRLICRQMGIGEEQGTIRFASSRKSSKADARGSQLVQVDALDCLLDGAAATYVKMDVEGMECLALRGAKEQLRIHRPKLAVCTYHSNADMVWVPKTILELNPDYKLYFRHYSHALAETVCYAVPGTKRREG